MTLREYINKASNKELAEMLICIKEVVEYNDDYQDDDEESTIWDINTMEFYVTTDGQMFGGYSMVSDTDFQEALAHQIELLESEYKENFESDVEIVQED